MRKMLFIVIIAAFVLIRPAQAQDFGYPADGEAWYSIRTNFPDASAVGKGLWTIKTVAVNGTRARDFAVFQDGKEMPGPEIDGGRAFELKVRWSWEKGREYEIRLDLENAKTGKSVALARKEKAPAKAGYWNPAWKNYLALILSEDNGFPRTGYPVHATIEKIIETHAPRIDQGLEIRKKEYESRWAKVQKAMAAKGYDLAYACGSELDRSDAARLKKCRKA